MIDIREFQPSLIIYIILAAILNLNLRDRYILELNIHYIEFSMP